MKVRHIRKRKQRQMDDGLTYWLGYENDVKMYTTRRLKPCPKYSPWCADCNAVLFRTRKQRFPHNVEEFDRFEDAVQRREMMHVRAIALMGGAQ